MNELKPCPFCGSANVSLRKGDVICGAVHCDGCGADVAFDLNKEEEDTWRIATTEKWNARKDFK